MPSVTTNYIQPQANSPLEKGVFSQQLQQPKNNAPYGQQVQDGKVFRFSGQNAATADQANMVRTQSEDKVQRLSDKQVELTQQIGEKEAWLKKDWGEHWGNYVFDPARVGYWTREFREKRDKVEAELGALKTQLEDVKKLKDIRLDSVAKHADTDTKALSSNLIPQVDRLKQNKTDNIIAANQGRYLSGFAF